MKSSQSSQDDSSGTSSSGLASAPRNDKGIDQSGKGDSYTPSNDDSTQMAVSDSSAESLSDADSASVSGSGSDSDIDSSSGPVMESTSKSTSGSDKNSPSRTTRASATASGDTPNSSDDSSSSESAAAVPLGKGLPADTSPDKDEPGAEDSAAGTGAETPQAGTNALTTNAGLPTAAIAVPLALVGATLAASLALCFAHRRALADQRARNARLIERVDSVRSGKSRGSRRSVRSGRSAVESDIEKAIDALYDSDRERGSLRAPRYPIPRQDVRRAPLYDYEPDRAYDDYSDDEYFGSQHEHERRSDQDGTRSQHRITTSYDRPRYAHHRSCDRMHTGRCSIDHAQRSSRSGGGCPSRSSSHYSAQSRRSNMRPRPIGRGADDDGNESTTESILTDYLPEPRLGGSFTAGAISSLRRTHYDSVNERPRPPPRAYTRRSVTESADSYYDYLRHQRRRREVTIRSPASDDHRTI